MGVTRLEILISHAFEYSSASVHKFMVLLYINLMVCTAHMDCNAKHPIIQSTNFPYTLTQSADHKGQRPSMEGALFINCSFT